MDSLYTNGGRQPAPPSVPPISSFWQPLSGGMGHIQHQSSLHEMDYNQFGVAPPTHNITSPPNTPMTPHVSGGGGFPGLVCSIDQHHHHTSSGSLVLHQNSTPPALSHSAWPPEYRLYALCQEMLRYSSQPPGMTENKASWEQFCVDYFHEMAILVIEADFGDGPKRYSLHGNLILWYFKSIAESGVTRFDVILGKRASHSYQQHMQRIECPEAVQELEYDIPTPTKVCSKGQLILEFTMEDKPRIMSWVFHIQGHIEMIPRFCLQAPTIDTALSNNITCQGIPASTQSILMQLNNMTMRPAPPQKIIQIDSNMWEHPPPPPPPSIPPSQRDMLPGDHYHHDDELVTLSTESSPMLTHIPTPTNQESSLLHPPPHPPPPPPHHHPPPHSIQPLTHSIPSSSSPLPPLSPTLVKSNGSSYGGSTCSVVSNSNTLCPTSSSSTSANKPSQSGVKKGYASSSSPTKKRSELVMIAAEPALFSEDMVHGQDERRITRIDNHSTKRSLTTPTTSSYLGTPPIPPPPPLSVVPEVIGESETTPTNNSFTNQNGSLAWLSIPSGVDWNKTTHKD